ncbi:MAG: hypothetical protein AABZ76_07490 [Pseudomonadota bacterium]
MPNDSPAHLITDIYANLKWWKAADSATPSLWTDRDPIPLCIRHILGRITPAQVFRSVVILDVVVVQNERFARWCWAVDSTADQPVDQMQAAIMIGPHIAIRATVGLCD